MSETIQEQEAVTNELTLSDEEVSSAQAEEQAAMNNAQLSHLNQRVVLLRATVNRLARENEKLRAQLESESIEHADEEKEDGK